MTRTSSARKVRNAETAFIVRGGEPGDFHTVAPWCLTPVRVTIKGRGKAALPQLHEAGRVSVVTGEVHGKGMNAQFPELNVLAACRRCQGCIAHKKKLWVSRAYHETIVSFRTWFGTLTFTPAYHEQALRAAMGRVWDDGRDYHALSPDEQQAVEATVLYTLIDRYWKRLRKEGYRFRYLAVPEPHENGLIHFHVLVHEVTPQNVPKSALERQWDAGLSHFRLVQTGDKRAVWYVCKYLGKVGAKPRASLAYGQGLDLSRPRAQRSQESCEPDNGSSIAISDRLGLTSPENVPQLADGEPKVVRNKKVSPSREE